MANLICFWVWRKPSQNQVPPSVKQVKIKVMFDQRATLKFAWCQILIFALKFNSAFKVLLLLVTKREVIEQQKELNV